MTRDNPMKTDMDEVKLTAYALGELDPAEAAEVEARLANDPAARQQVDQTRRLAGILTRELKAEAAPELPGEMKDAIAAKAGGGVIIKRRQVLKWAVNIAASLLILGIVGAMLLPSLGRAREEARRANPESRARQIAMMDAKQRATCTNDLNRGGKPQWLLASGKSDRLAGEISSHAPTSPAPTPDFSLRYDAQSARRASGPRDREIGRAHV